MKNALYLCAILFAVSQGVCSAQNSAGSLADRLRTTMLGGENTVAIISGEITAATPEKRVLLLDSIRQIIDDAFKVPPPWGFENNRFILASADVLRTISDEDAIVAAFASRLDKIPPNADCEDVVIYALGRCHNPAAIEAITKLARQRWNEITPWLPEPPRSTSQEQLKVMEAQSVSFLHAAEGLAASNSIFGKNIARELCDRYLKRFEGSQHYEEERTQIEQRIGRFLKQEIQPSHRPDDTGSAVSRPLPKQPQQPKSVTTTPLSVSDQTRGASKIGMAIAAGIGGVIVIGILIWFLRRK